MKENIVSDLWKDIDEIWVGNDLTKFSLADIKMLSYILKTKVTYLDKMFERRFLHIIEIARERDFSECKDMTISWHRVGKEIFVLLTINQLPSDFSISFEMLNMSDEDLVKNKDLCKYIR